MIFTTQEIKDSKTFFFYDGNTEEYLGCGMAGQGLEASWDKFLSIKNKDIREELGAMKLNGEIAVDYRVFRTF